MEVVASKPASSPRHDRMGILRMDKRRSLAGHTKSMWYRNLLSADVTYAHLM